MSIAKFDFNRKLVERIRNSILQERVFHAYLIEGDGLTDKEDFALNFCKAIVCEEKPGEGCDECSNCRKIDHGNYEDLYIVGADGASVKDEQISKLQSDLRRKPLNSRNMAIIKNADSLTARAQNRLLKTLEEPPEGAVIMLLSENRENLLPTIRSRCVLYRLEEEGEPPEIAGHTDEFYALLAEKKSFTETKAFLDKFMKSREDALLLLDGLERICGKRLASMTDRASIEAGLGEVSKMIGLIEEARRDLLQKVNYQYAIKNLVLKAAEDGRQYF